MAIKQRSHQKALLTVFNLVTAVLMLLGYVSVIAKFASITLSFVISAIILAVLLLSAWILKKHPIDWVIDDKILKIKSLPLWLKTWLLAALVIVWVPHIVEWFYPGPVVQTSLILKNEYEPGTLVEGIEWKNDLGEYDLKVETSKSDFEIVDLRICLAVHGGIVNNKTLSLNGAENVNYSAIGFTEADWVRSDNKVTETIKSYSSAALLTAVRLFPSGDFTIRLTIKVRQLPRAGINVSYYYNNWWGERVHKSINHPIHLRGSKDMYINTATTLKNRVRSYGIVLDTPVKGRGIDANAEQMRFQGDLGDAKKDRIC